MKSAVIITHAPGRDYMHDYVALPKSFPTNEYYSRSDVAGIRSAVTECLEALDKETGWKAVFRGRKVIVKPNLVSVMYKAGNALDEVPQTTDPRVFEAVVGELAKLDCEIVIAEGSGKGIPTMASFKTGGFDRIARHYGCKLAAIEEEPVDHYYVPKAEVQKDVWIPRIFSEVVRGEALYVSVPKMKTNLYTGVTLGFKNAMGTLSGNMRYRNHSWQIEKKLVDLLYLLKPDLTVLDGIIGGEGLTPAPVDPVPVGIIASGTNSVELDRVITRMMGIDPDELALTREADLRGFGDKDTVIIGEQTVTPFRRAESSFMTERFRGNWPNVKMLAGFSNDRVPRLCTEDDCEGCCVLRDGRITPDDAYAMEGGCRGGCLATMSMFMEMQLKAKHPADPNKVRFACIMGDGAELGGKRFWFDADGKAYSLEDLKGLSNEYRSIVQVGWCSKAASEACNVHIDACGNVGEVVLAMQRATGRTAPIISIHNKNLLVIGPELVKKWFRVRRLLKTGEMVEIPFDAWDDSIKAIPRLSAEEEKRDWIYVPEPKANREQIRANLKRNKLVDI